MGVRVDRWQALAPGVGFGLESSLAGLAGPAEIWAEALDLTGATALARYEDGPLIGKAALTEHHLDAGRALYLAWQPSVSQAEAVLGYLANVCGVDPLTVRHDPGLLVYRRGAMTLLLNFTDREQTAVLESENEVVVPGMDLKIINEENA